MIDQLRAARWFGGKSRNIRETRVVDRAELTYASTLLWVDVQYELGPPETYVLADRLEEPEVARAILHCFQGTTIPTQSGGSLVFRPTYALASVAIDSLEPIAPMRGEQSNTSIRFGDGLMLKLFRRVQYGPNPDVEVGWFLTEHSDFRGIPPVAGSATYIDADGREAALAMLQGFERNRGDAWTTTLARVRAVLDGADPSESISAMACLGTTTAKLHLALAGGAGDFASEPITHADLDTWRRAIRDEVRRATEALAAHDVEVDRNALKRHVNGINALEGALKTRHHGDYHLGQVLERQDGSFVIIDFEGEPAKPLAERREKRSPLRDVAGILRSFDYARHAALGPSNQAQISRAADWYAAARATFLDAYLETARSNQRLLPTDVEAPLAALELEKAAYEVLYELNNRPDWLRIPLAAFAPS